MNANPILLQKKYCRIIECFAKQLALSLDAWNNSLSIDFGFSESKI